MTHVRCHLRRGVDQALAMAQLEAAGMTSLSTVQDDKGGFVAFGEIETIPPVNSPLLFFFEEIAPIDTSVDWQQEWASSGADYHDGLVHVDLGEFGLLGLQPGPGFGDLSHPTTRLVLHLMAPHVAGRPIVDIGTGSGILALAAAKIGATSAIGIDIDPEAIAHAQENSVINELHEICSFLELVHADLQPSPDTLYLMNMIPLEQEDALTHLHLKEVKGEWITSGVLEEKRADYLKQCDARGWTLQDEVEEDKWLAFRFRS